MPFSISCYEPCKDSHIFSHDTELQFDCCELNFRNFPKEISHSKLYDLSYLEISLNHGIAGSLIKYDVVSHKQTLHVVHSKMYHYFFIVHCNSIPCFLSLPIDFFFFEMVLL